MGLVKQEHLLKDDITRALITSGKRPRRGDMIAFLCRNGKRGLRRIAVDISAVELAARLNEGEKRRGTKSQVGFEKSILPQ